MLFSYKAIDNSGDSKTGTIEAPALEIAISSLQKRGLVLSSIVPVEVPFYQKVKVPFIKEVSGREIVVLSRQIATLFGAQVSALQVFRLLAAESENPTLRSYLASIADDIQGGVSISKALSSHPDVFSDFYVNMVRAGEESGKLDATFQYLAEYLDRTYEVVSRVRNALVYPAFVVISFIGVVVVLFTYVIPKISTILVGSGIELPIYTRIVLGASEFFVQYIWFLLAAFVVGLIFLIRYLRTSVGQVSLDKFKLQVPYIGTLYRKLYLARIADNIHSMVWSGIPMVRAIEITSTVVDNAVFKNILVDASELVRAGNSFSASLGQSEEIPRIMVQMVKVGEETGEVGTILETMAKFYNREVINAVDTLISMIEPAMIVFLGVGVGVLLASVLLPIYNIAGSIA